MNEKSIKILKGFIVLAKLVVISDGKLYAYKYDKDGKLHVFYLEDVTDKVITGRGEEKQDE